MTSDQDPKLDGDIHPDLYVDADEHGSGYSADISFSSFSQRELFEDPADNEGAYTNEFKACLYFCDVPVGVLSGTLIRGDLVVRDGLVLQEDLDNISEALGELAEAIIDPETNDYNMSFSEKAQTYGRNILFLERLTLRDNFRGRRLGLALMQHVLRYCPHDVAVMKPYPLQHEATRTGEVAPAFKAFEDVELEPATARLRKYYARLGFQRYNKTEYMVRTAADNHEFIKFELEKASLD